MPKNTSRSTAECTVRISWTLDWELSSEVSKRIGMQSLQQLKERPEHVIVRGEKRKNAEGRPGEKRDVVTPQQLLQEQGD